MLHKEKKIQEQGFTLVEMMVGLALLGVFMTGIFGSVRLSSMISESTIYDSSAMVVAQSHLEQIKSLPYEDVLLASQNPSDVTLPTINPYYDASTNATVEDDPITLDPNQQPNLRTVTLDVRDNGNGTEINMPMKMWVSVVDRNTGSDPVEALEIKIRYAYQLPNALHGRWVERQVQTIRSRI